MARIMNRLLIRLLVFASTCNGGYCANELDRSFESNINFWGAVYFDISYEKARYELEKKYHGRDDNRHPFILEAAAKLGAAEKNFLSLGGPLSGDLARYNEDRAKAIYRSKIEYLSTIRFVGMFNHVRRNFPAIMEELVKHFNSVYKQYSVSNVVRQNELARSWLEDRIQIPIKSANTEKITWIDLTVCEFVKIIEDDVKRKRGP